MTKTRRSADSTMLCLYFCVLLVLAGGIHGTPVPHNFSFQVTTPLQVFHVRFSRDVVIDCSTNDVSAVVTLEKVYPQGPSNVPIEEGKITRSGSVFTIHNIIMDDKGKYRCVAEKNEHVIKRTIMVYIDTRNPELAIIPFKSRRVVSGANLYYTCEATMGNIEWYKTEEDQSVSLRLPANSLKRVVVKESIDANNILRKDLAFKNVDPSYSGLYSCVLTHEGRTLEKIVRVFVSDPDPAKIIDYSSSVLVVDSNQAELNIKCIVTGYPEPNITWRKDGNVIHTCYFPQRDCRYIEQHDSLGRHVGLQISRPRYPDDHGVFSCEAANGNGFDIRNFTVIVPVRPVLDRSVQTTFTFAPDQGKPVEIQCVLRRGSPDPTFLWSYQFCLYRRCSAWHDIVGKPDFKAVNTNSKSTLEISPSHLVPRMRFRCTAVNKIGSDEMYFDLQQRANS